MSDQLEPRDYPGSAVQTAIVAVLDNAEPPDPWVPTTNLVFGVADQLRPTTRRHPWPGDAFAAKVKREAERLVADGRLVKIGRGDRRPLADGSSRLGYGGEPHWQTAERAAELQAAHDAADAAAEAAAAAFEDRFTAVNKAMIDAGFPPAQYLDDDQGILDRVVIPLDVLERLVRPEPAP